MTLLEELQAWEWTSPDPGLRYLLNLARNRIEDLEEQLKEADGEISMLRAEIDAAVDNAIRMVAGRDARIHELQENLVALEAVLSKDRVDFLRPV